MLLVPSQPFGVCALSLTCATSSFATTILTDWPDDPYYFDTVDVFSQTKSLHLQSLNCLPVISEDLVCPKNYPYVAGVSGIASFENFAEFALTCVGDSSQTIQLPVLGNALNDDYTFDLQCPVGYAVTELDLVYSQYGNGICVAPDCRSPILGLIITCQEIIGWTTKVLSYYVHDNLFSFMNKCTTSFKQGEFPNINFLSGLEGLIFEYQNQAATLCTIDNGMYKPPPGTATPTLQPTLSPSSCGTRSCASSSDCCTSYDCFNGDCVLGGIGSSQQIECPVHAPLMVGIYGRSSGWAVYSVGLLCTNHDNEVVEGWELSTMSGGNNFNARCPNGTAVSQLNGYCSQDSLGFQLVCDPLRYAPVASSVVLTNNSLTNFCLFGEHCASDEFISAISTYLSIVQESDDYHFDANLGYPLLEFMTNAPTTVPGVSFEGFLNVFIGALCIHETFNLVCPHLSPVMVGIEITMTEAFDKILRATLICSISPYWSETVTSPTLGGSTKAGITKTLRCPLGSAVGDFNILDYGNLEIIAFDCFDPITGMTSSIVNSMNLPYSLPTNQWSYSCYGVLLEFVSGIYLDWEVDPYFLDETNGNTHFKGLSCIPLPPTLSPTLIPSSSPTPPTTFGPTNSPSVSPTSSPVSSSPTFSPSFSPSNTPTMSVPTKTPSNSPTISRPSNSPSTSFPSNSPSSSTPSKTPTLSPVTSFPSNSPSNSPSSSFPSYSPSITPSLSPSGSSPTKSPSESTPTLAPTGSTPTHSPSLPTSAPTKSPTVHFTILNCPANKPYLVGVFGSSGYNIDELGLVCASLSDGLSFSSSVNTSIIGKLTGANSFHLTCPTGAAVSSISPYCTQDITGLLITESLQLTCSPLPSLYTSLSSPTILSTPWTPIQAVSGFQCYKSYSCEQAGFISSIQGYTAFTVFLEFFIGVGCIEAPTSSPTEKPTSSPTVSQPTKSPVITFRPTNSPSLSPSSTYRNVVCPSRNPLMVGLIGQQNDNGIYFYLGILCANLTSPGVVVQGTGSLGSLQELAGMNSFSIQCPVNTAVTSFNGYCNSFYKLEAFQFICSPLPGYSVGRTTITSPFPPEFTKNSNFNEYVGPCFYSFSCTSIDTASYVSGLETTLRNIDSAVWQESYNNMYFGGVTCLNIPTSSPSLSPTYSPTLSKPTLSPTLSTPTISPSRKPTQLPTNNPSLTPSISPTNSFPTASPSTFRPTNSPASSFPSTSPSASPSQTPISYLKFFCPESAPFLVGIFGTTLSYTKLCDVGAICLSIDNRTVLRTETLTGTTPSCNLGHKFDLECPQGLAINEITPYCNGSAMGLQLTCLSLPGFDSHTITLNTLGSYDGTGTNCESAFACNKSSTFISGLTVAYRIDHSVFEPSAIIGVDCKVAPKPITNLPTTIPSVSPTFQPTVARLKLSCPDTAPYMVGFYGTSGWWLNTLGLICSSVVSEYESVKAVILGTSPGEREGEFVGRNVITGDLVG